ncbi:MAG TPA: hypothetical protein VHK86_05110, partial [Nitrososphaera sp.]|nr:hypothetical protein [Nitrososphaera sp.]
MSSTLATLLIILLCCASNPVTASQENWRKTLSKKLKEQYTLTKTGGWGGSDRNRIKEAGTVLVIQGEGVVGDKASDMTYSPTKVREGKIRQASSFLNSKENQHTFKPGDQVYLTDIDVEESEIRYWFVSRETYSISKRGNTEQSRYKGLIIFEFPKGYLEGADFEKIKETIGAVILSEEQSKASSTKTIELNQTFEQVESALGKPEKIIKLGTKTVYVYKDL